MGFSCRPGGAAATLYPRYTRYTRREPLCPLPNSRAPVPPMMRFLRRISLTQWILIAMVLGTLIGWAFPDEQWTGTVKFVSSQVAIPQGAVAKWLRQRIANPPSSVRLRPAPLFPTVGQIGTGSVKTLVVSRVCAFLVGLDSAYFRAKCGHVETGRDGQKCNIWCNRRCNRIGGCSARARRPQGCGLDHD